MDENKTYRIRLADGTEFTAVHDGLGNYIADSIVDEEILNEVNLSEVQIMDGTTVIATVINQVLRTYYTISGNRTFIRFSDMNELEKIEADYNAKLDYIACMTGVDLDE